MPRLFSGLGLPLAVKTSLSYLRGGLSGARWIEPDDFHITLKFLGDVPDWQADLFAQNLMEISFKSFSLEIAGVGSFGGNKPRAIWAGLKPSADLEALHLAHERAARLAEAEPDPRKFTPHITLARLKGARPYEVAAFLSQNGGLRLPPIMVDRFILFSSRTSLGGGPYGVEETYPAIDSEPEDDNEGNAIN